MTRLLLGSHSILNICRKREVMQLVFLTFFIFTAGFSCSKSSTTSPVSVPPPPCTTDFCILTGYKWEIFSQTISTDVGVYTYQTNQLTTINWATFIFKTDSTYLTYGGQTDNYSYSPPTKRLVLIDNLVPIHFNVAFPTKTSLTLNSDTIRMHPRTDSSVEANFAINSIAGALYKDFGVDTSKIHYVHSVYTYNGF
ncbi:MAG: hypothetical protein C5B59_07845 [Bacteroidetes bacterium]|nr:MAG: hypothetical protein C5B59_07845 [Bacteroidota bacterium]